MAEKFLIMTIGLPRSGKSTWARQLSQEQGYPIVNPDSIRLAIHGQVYAAQAEPLVWATAKVMVRSLFYAGHNVVILDATNTSRQRRNDWIDPEWNRVFQIFHTPKEECIRRATEGMRPDLISVIERMDATTDKDYFHIPSDATIKLLPNTYLFDDWALPVQRIG